MIPEHIQLLLADAQTSGGLLIAVAPDRLDLLLGALRARSVPVRAVVGRVETAAREGHIAVA